MIRPWRMTTTRLPASGFTLAELMITVVIIGILSAITITFSGNEWRRERVNTVALELAGWLEQVRANSLRETNTSTGAGGCAITLTPFTSQPAGTALASVLPTACSPLTPFLISGLATTPDRYSAASTNGASIIFTPRGSVITTSSADVDVKLLLNGTT